MCFYHFYFFFWLSLKFPQQNINQSETWIGGFQLSVELYVVAKNFLSRQTNWLVPRSLCMKSGNTDDGKLLTRLYLCSKFRNDVSCFSISFMEQSTKQSILIGRTLHFFRYICFFIYTRLQHYCHKKTISFTSSIQWKL